MRSLKCGCILRLVLRVLLIHARQAAGNWKCLSLCSGSSSERASVLRAIRTGSKRKEIYEDHGTEVNMSLSADRKNCQSNFVYIYAEYILNGIDAYSCYGNDVK